MTANPQLELETLLEALKDGLHALGDLRLVPHNDLDVLRLKRHLREKIAELENETSRALSVGAVA